MNLILDRNFTEMAVAAIVILLLLVLVAIGIVMDRRGIFARSPSGWEHDDTSPRSDSNKKP
jgi:hypothetical protein